MRLLRHGSFLALMLAAAPAMAAANRSFLVISQSVTLPDWLAAQVESLGATVTRQIPQIGILTVESSDGKFAVKASAIAGVRSVVPNLERRWIEPVAAEVVLEAGAPPTSGDDDALHNLQWGHAAIGAYVAWNAGYRGSGVRIAVVDDGIDADHPDLAPNVNAGLSVSFVPGENWNPPPGLYPHHGTQVAGIAAAADNGIGIIGVAPEAELVAVKVLTNAGLSTEGQILGGIVYAADVGSHVINLSFGDYLLKNGDKMAGYTAMDAAEIKNAYARATTYAHDHGATVIASAGNAAIDFDRAKGLVHLPGDAPFVTSIAATAPIGWGVDPATDLDVPTYYTNYGRKVIGFAAPGGTNAYRFTDPSAICTVAGITRPCFLFDHVISTIPGGWAWAAGTSMAAPHASGVAALIIGIHGGALNPDQVVYEMRESADDLGKPGQDAFFGAGRVNAANAVP